MSANNLTLTGTATELPCSFYAGFYYSFVSAGGAVIEQYTAALGWTELLTLASAETSEPILIPATGKLRASGAGLLTWSLVTEPQEGTNNPAIENYLSPQTLTDGATIAYNVDSGVQAKVTLGGDRALAALTNVEEGQSGTLVVIQDGTGGRALTLDASYTVMAGDPADIASQGANKVSVLAWHRRTGVTYVWLTQEA